MATFTISSCADTFPVGTSVGAYLARYRINGSSPSGSSAATATVASNGSLAFTDLADDTEYVAYASVGGVHKYRSFQTSRPRYTGQEIVGPLSDGYAPVWSDSDDALVATPVAKTTETNTFTDDQRVDAAMRVSKFGVAADPNARIPVQFSHTVSGAAAVADEFTGNVIGVVVSPTFSGDFSGMSGSDPGRMWALDVFGAMATTSGVDHFQAGLCEAALTATDGGSLDTFSGFQTGAFLWTNSTASADIVHSLYVATPIRMSGATGTFNTLYNVFIESADTASGYTNGSRFSLYVHGGTTRLGGRLDVTDTIANAGSGALKMYAGFASSDGGAVSLDKTASGGHVNAILAVSGAKFKVTDGTSTVATIDRSGGITAETAVIADVITGTTLPTAAATFQTTVQTTTGTVALAQGAYARTVLDGASAGATITQAVSLRVAAPAKTNSASGTITTAYGIYVDQPTDGASNFALYVAGGVSRFLGRIDAYDTIQNAGSNDLSFYAVSSATDGGRLTLARSANGGHVIARMGVTNAEFQVNDNSGTTWSVTRSGVPKWISGNTQTTVGAAGAASALPAAPTGYLKINVGSTTYAVPYYAAS